MLENIHKFANEKSRPIARYGTRKHTCKKIRWGCATKGEPKCGIHENALLAQYMRDASTIAQ